MHAVSYQSMQLVKLLTCKLDVLQSSMYLNAVEGPFLSDL